jgi:hypothetical protein
MRYTLALLLFTTTGIFLLKGGLPLDSQQRVVAQNAADQDQEDFNEMSVDPTPPEGLNDQSTQYWYSLTPEQKQAVRQDIQNGLDPNQAVMNYAQKNNQIPENVEGSGSYPTNENYDTQEEMQDSTGSNFSSDDNILQKSTTKDFSGKGSTEDEDEDRKKEEQKDPANRPYYAPGGENSPAPGNQW